MEQEAMAFPVLKVLRGEAEAITYSGKNVWQVLKASRSEPPVKNLSG
jgi:hypothetical protein